MIYEVYKECRIWYAKQAICNGWSSNILELQIQGGLYERTGGTVNNFDVSLPKNDSDMARDIFKDPYLFDFLGTDMPRREIEIERKLIEHIQQFLLELGQVLHGNSELKRLIRMYDLLKYK